MKQALVVLPVLAFSCVNAFCDTLTVNATADIYAAGHAGLPATVDPGSFAPGVSFAATVNQVLIFSSVTGMVGCNFAITNGPDGTCFPGVSTTVTSYGGLSGISANAQNMFLVGVFLDNNEPVGAGPAVLTYNYGTSGSLNFSDPTFTPAINQVFFIGDGLTGTGSGAIQLFNVPSTATRLYLGFADSFDSVPSFYADDVGSLSATFSITSAPEPAMLFPAALTMGLFFWIRKNNV